MAMVFTPQHRKWLPIWRMSWVGYERARDLVIDVSMVLAILGLGLVLYLRPDDPIEVRRDEWLLLALSGAVLFFSRLRKSLLASK